MQKVSILVFCHWKNFFENLKIIDFFLKSLDVLFLGFLFYDKMIERNKSEE